MARTDPILSTEGRTVSGQQHETVNKTEARNFADAWMRNVAENGTIETLARTLGMTNRRPIFAMRRRAEAVLGIELPTPTGSQIAATKVRMRQQFSVAKELPPHERPVEEIIADRLKYTKRKLNADGARELIDVNMDIDGPFAVALIGDPHIDNPGCNLELLISHTDLIRATDGMFALCVGDVQDGWIGRLARLWAHQGIAASESQQLVDWWLKQLTSTGRLLALIEGNHDGWVQGLSGQSPLDWIRGFGTIKENHGVRLRLRSKDGTVVTINARHDFPGRSQYNAAHGPMKSLLFGCRDDVAVAGHTHEFGYGVRLDPETRRPLHAVRLGSYKHSDEYARQLGLLDNNVTECAVLMVNPMELDPRHRTWVVHNPFQAARELRALREEWTNAKAKSRRDRTAGKDAGRRKKGTHH